MAEYSLQHMVAAVTEASIDLEVLRQRFDYSVIHQSPTELTTETMNRAYDNMLDNLMELFHQTQEMRREYNTYVRIQRHQDRLASQRERRRNAMAANDAMEILAEVAIQEAPAPRMAKPKSKALKKSEVNVLVPDDCGICLEKSTRIQSVDTCCGHTFCKTCFDSYRASVLAKPTRTERVIKCPLCRKVNPKITEFRERKAPTKKTPVEVTHTDIDELVRYVCWSVLFIVLSSVSIIF